MAPRLTFGERSRTESLGREYLYFDGRNFVKVSSLCEPRISRPNAAESVKTLTPEEKIDFFNKIKNMFKPSADDIGDKMKMKEKFKPSADEIGEKIKTGMKMKDKFKPVDDVSEAVEGSKPKLTPDEIAEKIKTSMKMKNKFKPSADDIAEKIKAKAAAVTE